MVLLTFSCALCAGCVRGDSVSGSAHGGIGERDTEARHLETARLPYGTVGFIRVASETADAYELEVAFPGEYRDFVDFSNLDSGEPWYKRTAPIVVTQPIAIFDAEGVAGMIPADADIRIRFWTENDGGSHFRPAATLTLEKAALKRPFAIREGYGAFVVHGGLLTTPPTHSFSESKRELVHVTDDGDEFFEETRVILEGDYDADGAPDARILSVDLVDILYHSLETRHSRDDVVDGGP